MLYLKHRKQRYCIFLRGCECILEKIKCRKKQEYRFVKTFRTWNKKRTFEDFKSPYNLVLILAEREGFEPPDLLQSTVFKTAAFDRSAISPKWNNLSFQWCKCKDIFYIDKFIYRIFTLKSLMFWKSILKIYFISKADFLNTPQKAPMLCLMSNTKPKFHTVRFAKEWCFP